MRQTDILIRLHASLEVGTRDNLYGSVFTKIHSGYVRRIGKGWRGRSLRDISLRLGIRS